jgi:hypothetical protein
VELEVWGLEGTLSTFFQGHGPNVGRLLTVSTSQDWEGAIFDREKDAESWIAAPITAEESGLMFKVDDKAE